MFCSSLLCTVSYLNAVGRIVVREYNVKMFWYLSLQKSDIFFKKNPINTACHVTELCHKC